MKKLYCIPVRYDDNIIYIIREQKSVLQKALPGMKMTRDSFAWA